MPCQNCLKGIHGDCSNGPRDPVCDCPTCVVDKNLLMEDKVAKIISERTESNVPAKISSTCSNFHQKKRLRSHWWFQQMKKPRNDASK